MNELADTRPPRWFTRPIVWLCASGLLLILLAMAAWWAARTGVRMVQRHGGELEWEVSDAAYWAEDHLGISTDFWTRDGNVTTIYGCGGSAFFGTFSEGLDDAELLVLGRFPKLTVLQVASRSVTDAGIERLIDAGGLRRLTSLQLDECHSLSGRGVATFSRLPDLETLWISASSIAVSGSDLSGFTKLETLHTDIIPLSNADLDVIARLPRLTWLDLYDTAIDDEGLAALAQCRQLTILDLSRSQVTDTGVVQIAKHCPNLTSLWLDGTQVTNECLSVVEQLPNLEILYVNDTAVTEAAAKRIMAAHPDIEVTAGVVE